VKDGSLQGNSRIGERGEGLTLLHIGRNRRYYYGGTKILLSSKIGDQDYKRKTKKTTLSKVDAEKKTGEMTSSG